MTKNKTVMEKYLKKRVEISSVTESHRGFLNKLIVYD